MNSELIKRHNEIVGVEDRVLFLGDVAMSKADLENACSQMNGIKTLIKGNHDNSIDDSIYEKYFERIVEYGQGLNVKFGEIEAFATHAPTNSMPGKFNIVGHIHGAWRFQKNMINAGVDVHHFRPVSVSNLAFIFNSIKTYSDKDVWFQGNFIDDESKSNSEI